MEIFIGSKQRNEDKNLPFSFFFVKEKESIRENSSVFR
jgi:hypothetical protein